MATRRKRQDYLYKTDGSLAYRPVYHTGAASVPRRKEDRHYAPPIPKQREKVRPKALTRERVQVREAGKISLFAVVGFLAVGVFAALLTLSYAQLAVVTDQMVTLRGELAVLETESASLAARYEQVFDLGRIQGAVEGTMTRPVGEQVVYIDLSEPDRVILFDQQDGEGGIKGFLASAEEIAADLVEYFQ